MADWYPARGQNAIVIAGAQVNFSGPLPALTQQKVIARAREAASTLELPISNPVHGFEFNPKKAAARAREIGLVLTSAEPGAEVPGVNIDFTKQLQVDETSAVFRMSVYSSWNDFLSDAKIALSEILKATEGVISIASLRLEYLDNFAYQGSFDDPDAAHSLLKSGRLIAPHVFETAGSWHSHAGYSAPLAGPNSFAITQAHLDCQTLNNEAGEHVKVLNMMTGREDRRPFASSDDNYTPDAVFSIFDSMHDDLIAIAKELLSDGIRHKIGLD